MLNIFLAWGWAPINKKGFIKLMLFNLFALYYISGCSWSVIIFLFVDYRTSSAKWQIDLLIGVSLSYDVWTGAKGYNIGFLSSLEGSAIGLLFVINSFSGLLKVS